jgi:DNA-directed RNA polymerase subunit RPC12/RpoP
MKDKMYIPMPKKEDQVTLIKRREDYALTRDQQAFEFNEAINKRLRTEAMNIKKCTSCGKEFSFEPNALSPELCQDCSGKAE